MCSGSHDLFNFGKITDNNSKTVQNRVVVVVVVVVVEMNII